MGEIQSVWLARQDIPEITKYIADYVESCDFLAHDALTSRIRQYACAEHRRKLFSDSLCVLPDAVLMQHQSMCGTGLP